MFRDLGHRLPRDLATSWGNSVAITHAPCWNPKPCSCGVEVCSIVLPGHGPGLVPWVPSRFGGSLGITVGNHGPAGLDIRRHLHFWVQVCSKGLLDLVAQASSRFGDIFLKYREPSLTHRCSNLNPCSCGVGVCLTTGSFMIQGHHSGLLLKPRATYFEPCSFGG